MRFIKGIEMFMKTHLRLLSIAVILVLLSNGAYGVTPVNEIMDYTKLSWMSPNEYRPLIFMNGLWEYRSATMDHYSNIDLSHSIKSKEEITFRKIFELDSTAKRDYYRLVCYGVNEYATIYVNSKFIGTHTGGYSSFYFDIPAKNFYFTSKNILELKVQSTDAFDNYVSMKHTFLSPDNPDFIHGDVFLIALPHDHIDLHEFKYNLGNDYKNVSIEIDLSILLSKRITPFVSNPKFVVRYMIHEKDSPRPLIDRWQAVEQVGGVTIHQRFSTSLKDPVLWGPENPQLYELVVTLYRSNKIVDSITRHFGFCDFRVDATELKLNGNRLTLRGINYLRPDLRGDSLLSMLERDISLLKELNINAIRAYGHIPHPYLVSLCDHNGIILFEDVPFDWMPVNSFLGHFSQEAAFDYVKEALSRDRFNVSFAGIGANVLLGRGPSDADLNSKINLHRNLIVTNVFSDYLDQYLIESDVINVNFYDIVYEQDQSIKEQIENLSSSRVVFVSIMVPLESPLNFSDRDPLANQKHQANQLNRFVNQLGATDAIDGYFLNSLRDWKTCYPMTFIDPTDDPYSFKSGLLENDFEQRISYKFIASFYDQKTAYQESIVKLYKRLPNLFTIIGIVTILFFLLIYNSRKYFQENIKRIFVHPHGFFVDIRDKRKVPISHTLLVILFYSLGLSLLCTTIFYFYRSNPVFDHLLTLFLMRNDIKSKVVSLLWQPGKLLMLLTLFFTIGSMISGFIIYLFVLIFRKKVSPGHTLTVTFWTFAIYMIFIPLGMVLYRILLIEILIVPVYLIFIGINLWFVARLIKAIKVLFYWSGTRATMLVSAMLILLIVIIIYFYYDRYKTLDYFIFYLQNLL